MTDWDLSLSDRPTGRSAWPSVRCVQYKRSDAAPSIGQFGPWRTEFGPQGVFCGPWKHPFGPWQGLLGPGEPKPDLKSLSGRQAKTCGGVERICRWNLSRQTFGPRNGQCKPSPSGSSRGKDACSSPGSWASATARWPVGLRVNGHPTWKTSPEPSSISTPRGASTI